MSQRWGRIGWILSGPLCIANHWVWGGNGWLIWGCVNGVIAALIFISYERSMNASLYTRREDAEQHRQTIPHSDDYDVIELVVWAEFDPSRFTKKGDLRAEYG